jgi:hypothetical protein
MQSVRTSRGYHSGVCEDSGLLGYHLLGHIDLENGCTTSLRNVENQAANDRLLSLALCSVRLEPVLLAVC